MRALRRQFEVAHLGAVVMKPFMEGASADRRWHPVADTSTWDYKTRQAVFDAVRACLSHALCASLRSDASPQELHASDVVFRELHDCTETYARVLYAVGQGLSQVVALIIAAARGAATPDELHPSIVSALQQWCYEAQTPVA
jgi:hypothetical protein